MWKLTEIGRSDKTKNHYSAKRGNKIHNIFLPKHNLNTNIRYSNITNNIMRR